ncbi:hypothetical protein P8452_25494 [Trifolium repens]|nr:hypothetical protein P8452_25494 [Trifolium repens]
MHTLLSTTQNFHSNPSPRVSNNGNCSPEANGSPNENDRKRVKKSYRSKSYKVEINFASKIPLQAIANALEGHETENYQEAIRVLDIILRQHAAIQGCLQSGLSLNIDVSTTMIVRPGPVVDFLIANQNVRDPFSLDWNKAKRTLKNLRVTASPSNQEYKIIGLSELPCKDQL